MWLSAVAQITSSAVTRDIESTSRRIVKRKFCNYRDIVLSYVGMSMSCFDFTTGTRNMNFSW